MAVTKTALEATTNVFYANSVAGKTSIITAVSQADMYKASSIFHANNVKPVTDYVEGSENFDTFYPLMLDMGRHIFSDVVGVVAYI